MRRRVAFLLAVIFPAQAAEPPHLALVISNAIYRSLPPLPACQASASLLVAALRRGGWSVTDLRDPSNGQMGAAIGTLGDALAGPAPVVGAAFVYECGFVATYERRLFLLPSSVNLARDTDVLTAGLVAPALTGPIAGSKIPAAMLALDPIPLPGDPAIEPNVAQLRTPAPRTGILAAANPDPGPAAPTPLAVALATALAEPTLTVADLQTAVQRSLTGKRGLSLLTQPPSEPAWLQGEAPPAPEPPAPAAPQPAPAPAPSVAAPTAPDQIAPLGDLDRRRVQIALQRLGYYAGRIDGLLGGETLAAIRRYQHELGASMTGDLTLSQAARLLAEP